MKKWIVMLAACTATVLLTGCIGGMKADHQGFATAPGGMLISNMKGGQFVQERVLENRPYEILGVVKSQVMTVNYLGLISQGDASYQELKRKALEKYRDADDIINIELDFNHDNLLGIVNKVFVEMTATAIKYKK